MTIKLLVTSIFLITSIFVNAQLISAKFNIDQTEGCETLNVTLENVSTPNPDQLIWDFGDGTTEIIDNPTWEQISNHSYTEVGEYEITLSAILGEDTSRLSKSVHVYALPNANFEYELAGYPTTLSDTLYYSNQRYLFTAEEALDSSHTWTINGIEQVNKTDELVFKFESSGVQNVIHSITVNGCTSALDSTFTILGEDIKIPNVFTPNSDGVNDIFYIKTDGQTPYKFAVLNRHGNRVYTSDSKIISWDGYSYWGEQLDTGTYYYTLESDKGDVFKGAILLVR